MKVNDKQSPIPVTIVSGFLGAGKTTLLNHILTSEHGIKIGVLVNDFGSINVDANLISEVDDGVVNLANGCVCCSIRMDLVKSILSLATMEDRPDHIIIESSGVADPKGIVESFNAPEIWEHILIDGVVTVVDADQALDVEGKEKELAEAQVKGADLLLLNKVDLASDEKVEETENWIKSLRPGVQIFPAVNCNVPFEVLVGSVAKSSPPKGELTGVDVSVNYVNNKKQHLHKHDLMFDTWTYRSDNPFKLDYIQQLLTNLPGELFRAKGVMYCKEKGDSPLILQLVGKRATIKPMSSNKESEQMTELVFIGRHQAINFNALESALLQCLA
ncbi:CobW family GTP-binding protein [Ferrimonas balearica]|uniref:CobW family GTP-binding protein n=1 Tax=Ferrimonas balearica TaxID=44012 RepID=UPI001C990D68|nr:GTP-binding protein [Ferrimonas balearica]MBY5991369.1 GTP-binding protein [Ferrimonas balearica]